VQKRVKLSFAGAGKTTFLKLLGGKHMVPEQSIQVLGHPPFRKFYTAEKEYSIWSSREGYRNLDS